MSDETKDNPFLRMEVAAILDKVTIAVGGTAAGKLRAGEKLDVLGIGAPISPGGPHVVVAKARLTVSRVADVYAIAENDETETVKSGLAGFSTIGADVTRRKALQVRDEDVIGNPGRLAIAKGDPVIRPADFREFVAALRR